jgi:multiple sugar transport system substrate-binding protein
MAETRLRLISRQFVGFERAFGRQIAAYRARQPQVEIACEYTDVPPLFDTMVTRGGALSGDYDLFLAVTDWLPLLMRDGLVLPLDDRLRADPPPEWPEGWPETLRRLQRDNRGRTYGIAYHDGPEVFMYRTDLFEDPQEQARFRRQYGRDLAVPRTWSEFLDVARFFTRPDDDLHGCVVAAKADGHNDVYDFALHLWSRGGRLLDERMRPAFNSPEGEAALRFYVDLIHEHHVTQPEPWEYDSVASGDYYASGRAAMMWNWCGFQSVADLPELSRIPGRTRSTMLPGGDGPTGRQVSLIVYWVMTIPAGSRQPDAAWSFLRHLATPEMDLVTAEEGGSGTRLSTWRDPDIRRRFQYYQVIERVHRHVETLPAIPEYPAVNGVLDRMMAAAVGGRAPVSEALQTASAAVEALLEQAGYYR